MDNLTGMAVFARVAEANSFSGAARRLGLSKAAVSKQVARLERVLGVRLLNRTTRKLSLTEVGQAFYEHCARVVAEAEAAELAVSRLRSEPRGVLRLTAPAAFGHLHVAPAIPDFLDRHPELAVQMVMNDRTVDLAEEGFDVAIRVSSEPTGNLVARRLAPIRWVVCAAPQYLQRRGTPQTPHELAQHNCLFYSFLEGSADWGFTLQDGESATVRVAGNFTVSNSEALREAVLRGLGVALLPTFTVGRDIQTGALQALLPDCTPRGTFGTDIYAVYLPTRYLSPKVRAFVDFFLERFGPEPYWDGAAEPRRRDATPQARTRAKRRR